MQEHDTSAAAPNAAGIAAIRGLLAGGPALREDELARLDGVGDIARTIGNLKRESDRLAVFKLELERRADADAIRAAVYAPDTQDAAGTKKRKRGRFELVTLADLRDEYSAETIPLVAGYIARSELTFLPGPQESLKSWAMVDLARAVHTGGKWLDHFPVERGAVIYLEHERVKNFVYQASLLEKGNGCDLSGLEVLPPCRFDLRDRDCEKELTAIVERKKPTLLVINSWREVYHAHPGDGVATAEALGWLGHLAEDNNTAVVVMDQLNKPGAAGQVRGRDAHSDSAQKEYSADAVLHVEREFDEVGRGKGPARLYPGKGRGTREPGSAFSYEVQPIHPEGVKVVWLEEIGTARLELSKPAGARDKVLAALSDAGEGVTADALARNLGVPLGTVKNTLTQLKKAGQARQADAGAWLGASSQSQLLEVCDCDDATNSFQQGWDEVLP